MISLVKMAVTWFAPRVDKPRGFGLQVQDPFDLDQFCFHQTALLWRCSSLSSRSVYKFLYFGLSRCSRFNLDKLYQLAHKYSHLARNDQLNFGVLYQKRSLL